jgi:hypothetical protein
MLQAGRSWVRVRMRWIFFQSTYSFQPHYGSGVDSASNTNEYQESAWSVKDGRRVRLATLLPSVTASTSQNPMGLHGLLYRVNFTFLPFTVLYCHMYIFVYIFAPNYLLINLLYSVHRTLNHLVYF